MSSAIPLLFVPFRLHGHDHKHFIFSKDFSHDLEWANFLQVTLVQTFSMLKNRICSIFSVCRAYWVFFCFYVLTVLIGFIMRIIFETPQMLTCVLILVCSSSWPGFPSRQLQMRVSSRFLLSGHYGCQSLLQRHSTRGGIRTKSWRVSVFILRIPQHIRSVS